ncbi:unnamed protein product, partial [Choristocarpus tenellus]
MNDSDSANVPTTDATSVSGIPRINLTRKTASRDVNELHTRLGDVHQGLDRKYASAQNILLTGIWGPSCRGCPLGKGHRHPIPKEMENRASVKGEDIYADSTGTNSTSEEEVVMSDDLAQEGARGVDFAQDETGGIDLNYAGARDVDFTQEGSGGDVDCGGSMFDAGSKYLGGGGG